ncbi:hypothetical protein [Bacteroides ihuae]|uniref:hypothetical protein n=1 Tax=Bacteroides ihuae TaxID=1852362 RepID=UPI00135645E4|nr:hypothetical protein [Bacteroides ihuae]
MKKLILSFILMALMPVCNSMYAQLQGTYIGVSLIISPVWYRYITPLVPCATLSWYRS